MNINNKLPKIAILLVLVLIVGGAAGVSGYFYYRYEQLRKNPDMISQKEIESLTGVISKHMELPTDEQPSLATITDNEKLKEQDFFKKAQNGDKILIYAKAKKAILYRPATGKIVEFAPLLVGDGTNQESQPTDQPQSQAQQSVSVAIYNGTTVSGLSREIEEQLNEVGISTISKKVNAAKSSYTQSLVMDLSGNHSQEANAIAQKINGKIITTLPEGEEKPAEDILVIAGK